jgi:CO/xanthine dehydrogenase Mo-binding subunit
MQVDPNELHIHGQIVRSATKMTTSLSLGSIAYEVMPGGSLFDGRPPWRLSNQPFMFGSNTHVARVSLDMRTGLFAVVDYLVAHDASVALNPMIVEGQIVGDAVDGTGKRYSPKSFTTKALN